MISIDTETTGLYFTHGCTTFNIGLCDGTDFVSFPARIQPLTRQRRKEYSKDTINSIRSYFDSADIVCMHNANFDLKALANAGVINITEPNKPEFWERIVDTTVLSHLVDNTTERSLKDLAPKYLGVIYSSEELLNTLVNKCRTFVRSRRPNWRQANRNEPTLKPSSSTTRWWKCDMWLPTEVLHDFDECELTDYGLHCWLLETCVNSYLEDDCRYTHDLCGALLHEAIKAYDSETLKYLETNKQIHHVIWKMETQGTPVRSVDMQNAISICESWITNLTAITEDMVKIKHLTDAKLRAVLYDHYELPELKKTPSGSASVDADTIVKLKHYCNENPEYAEAGTFLANILALKKYQKKLGYLTSYDNCTIEGKVYPNYNIVGTDTLRLSANNPSPQTVSKATNPFEDDFEDVSQLLEQSPPLRSVFGPADGRWWLCNDYSQLQLRIFAVVTNEQEMIAAFEKGWDAHDYTARRIFGLRDSDTPTKAQRRIAKNVNFGFIFGASPKRIEKTAGHPGLWDIVCEMFPNAHDFIEQQKQLLKSGDLVRTLGGYPLDVPTKFVLWKGTNEKAAHAAVCYIVQGSEGEIVKRAMRLTDDYLTQHYPQGRLVMQVHDEISFDVPARIPKHHVRNLRDLMQEAASQFGVYAPVNCEVATRRWNETRDVCL